MGKLILVRHGKSLWNIENIFTGWTDIDLAPQGIVEANKAGELGHWEAYDYIKKYCK